MTILSVERKNTDDGVIRGVCPDQSRKGRVEIVEGVCRTKGRFERLTSRKPDSRGALARKPSQWDGDIGL